MYVKAGVFLWCLALIGSVMSCSKSDQDRGKGSAVGAEAASVALAQLAASFWEGELAAHPVEATALGDRRYDPRLEDISPAGRERDRKRLEDVRHQAEAIEASGLSSQDRITRSMLLEIVDGELATLDCDFENWLVDPLEGPQVAFQNIPSLQPVETPQQAQALVQRWLAMGPYMQQHMENLRAGLAEGRVATRQQVERVLDELEEFSKAEVPTALLSPLETSHPDWSAEQRQEFESALRGAVQDVIRPAFARYRTFLHDEVLPQARSQENVGLSHVPGGEECYAAMIRRHTSLDLPAEEIHRIGLAEVERIMAEMRTLGSRVLGTSDQKEILQRLRSDPALHFRTRDEVENKAREALARAQAAVPGNFGILPKAPCEVVRMEPHEEEHSTIAYYRQPAVDGSRPGRYYINTFAPTTRPRYEAEALAFHEAVPGHHLQIAIAQELDGIPEFRKHLGSTAFVEGWGLYAEQLSDEMGLYSGDLDRIGKLSFEAWRACRLVVDTGMHAMGWSRQQAIDFMLANSALAENNIVNEVDRYITWPGQALAYKLGQLEILRLRQAARQAQGDGFSLAEFHDVVLGNGAVTLTTLDTLVREHYGLPASKGGVEGED